VPTKVEKSVVVNVPVETVYNQWTQFEEFPHFMGGISQIQQLDDTTMRWVADIGGVRREWTAKILEQVPNEKVSWAATEGATNAGAVYFSPAGAGQTNVRLELEYEPEGVLETVADKVGAVGRRVEADLNKFKSFIEDAGYASAPGAARSPARARRPASRRPPPPRATAAARASPPRRSSPARPRRRARRAWRPSRPRRRPAARSPSPRRPRP
jgi:uncharacterized membrane protein